MVRGVPEPLLKPDDPKEVEARAFAPTGWKAFAKFIPVWGKRDDLEPVPVWSCFGHMVTPYALAWIRVWIDYDRGHGPAYEHRPPMYTAVCHALSGERNRGERAYYEHRRESGSGGDSG